MLSKIRFYVFATLLLLTIALGGVSCCSCRKMYQYKAEKKTAEESLKTAEASLKTAYAESAKKDSVINTLSKVLPAKIDTVKIEVIKEIHKTDSFVLFNTSLLQRIDSNVLIIKNKVTE